MSYAHSGLLKRGAEVLFGRLAVRNVIDHRNDVIRVPRLTAYQCHGNRGPDHRTVFSYVSFLAQRLVGQRSRASCLAQELFTRMTIVLMRDIRELARQQFVRGIDENLAKFLIDSRDGAIEPGMRNSNRGLVKDSEIGLDQRFFQGAPNSMAYAMRGRLGI